MVDKFTELFGDGNDAVNEYKTLGAKSRVKGLQPVHLMSTFLDPRFKDLKCFSENDKNSIYTMIIEEMKKVIIPTDSVNTSDYAGSIVTKQSSLSIFELESDDDVEDMTLVQPNVVSIDEEMLMYKNEKKMKRETTRNNIIYATSPLNFWKENSGKYPRLSILAKKLLCITATSAPVERVFSNAGITINEKRNRLGSDRAGDLIMLSDNWDILEKHSTFNNSPKIINIDDINNINKNMVGNTK